MVAWFVFLGSSPLFVSRCHFTARAKLASRNRHFVVGHDSRHRLLVLPHTVQTVLSTDTDA